MRLTTLEASVSIHKNIYLDKEFISDLYEETTGKSPGVNITSSSGSNAGIKALFMSAKVSLNESKSYKISTTKMLKKLEKDLKSYYLLDYKIQKELGYNSKFLWVTGSMSVQKTTVSSQKQNVTITKKSETADNVGEPIIKSEEKYFSIKDTNDNEFPLIANADYFYTSFSDLIELTGTVIKAINIEVEALVRVLPARTSFDGWMAIPLIIREKSS
jgi:hypothetical protein